MNKILAGLAALAGGGVLAAIIALSNSPTPAPAPRAVEAELVQAPAAPPEYDYQSVWVLFEESCRGDEFMDIECSCLMRHVTDEHGVEATAWLALMGWDRFAEADAIKDRLGESEIKRAIDHYQSKAGGTCAGSTLVPGAERGPSTHESVPDDAVATPVDAASDSDGDVKITDENDAGQSREPDKTEDNVAVASATCVLENATKIPGHLGTPVLRVRDGNIEPLGALSGGFQTRVGIARESAASPDILLLDEPTSNLDPSDVSNLTACAVYSSRPARLGPGPSRGFTGNLTIEGSDLPITAGGDYVIWDEALGSTTRHPLNQQIDVSQGNGTQIVFLNVGSVPAGSILNTNVAITPNGDVPIIDIDLIGARLSLLVLLGTITDYQFLNLTFGGWPFFGPLPVNQVMLVPEGPVGLSWEDETADRTPPKLCYLTQIALMTALAERGYTALEASLFILSILEDARGPNADLCVILKARAILGDHSDSNIWHANLATEAGPGLHVLEVK